MKLEQLGINTDVVIEGDLLAEVPRVWWLIIDNSYSGELNTRLLISEATFGTAIIELLKFIEEETTNYRSAPEEDYDYCRVALAYVTDENRYKQVAIWEGGRFRVNRD